MKRGSPSAAWTRTLVNVDVRTCYRETIELYENNRLITGGDHTPIGQHTLVGQHRLGTLLHECYMSTDGGSCLHRSRQYSEW
jgi:propanediol dehydratase large subunit